MNKKIEKIEVTRYEIRLVAQGFSQGPGINYEEMYSSVMDAIKEGLSKNDIPPRFFTYIQELEEKENIEVKYIRSSDSAADLFTKALPTTMFKNHIQSIGTRYLRDL